MPEIATVGPGLAKAVLAASGACSIQAHRADASGRGGQALATDCRSISWPSSFTKAALPRLFAA